jgi:hypothetical protein
MELEKETKNLIYQHYFGLGYSYEYCTGVSFVIWHDIHVDKKNKVKNFFKIPESLQKQIFELQVKHHEKYKIKEIK